MGETFQGILDFVDLAREAQGEDALWDAFAGFMRGQGADRFSYHHIPPDSAPDRKFYAILAEGFDERWVSRYVSEKLYRIDPIVITSAHATRPFIWSSIHDVPTLAPAQRGYLADMRAAIPGDGYSIPVFGPASRAGYIGVGFDAGAKVMSDALLQKLSFAAQSFHVYFSEIRLKRHGGTLSFTAREKKVLDLIARGIPMNDVTALLSVSQESLALTVKNICRQTRMQNINDAVQYAILAGVISPLD